MRTVLRVVDAVAILEGLLCTVGMTSLVAMRCERVMLPSELGHMITISVLAIVFPKPLYEQMSHRSLCRPGREQKLTSPSSRAFAHPC